MKCALAAFGIACSVSAGAQLVTVTDSGPSTDTTCTLAQAIGTANAANGVTAAADGSIAPVGNCTGASLGMNLILFNSALQTITLTGADNHWYGPNALPPIASTIQIIGAAGQGVTLIASHAGDPTPSTGNAFRFFYVSGGFELPAGSLLLVNVVLQGGSAKGGDSSLGGGGAGMGGAIFNQGSLQLTNVSLLDNSARGGSIDASGNQGGGGIGQDGLALNGGAVGGSLGNVGYGGNGSEGAATPLYGGGGGGGFVSGSDSGSNPFGAAGGGKGGLGGAGGAYGSPGGPGGDGGGGGEGNGAPSGASGGSFGNGGAGTGFPGGGGGGGVGGGGGAGFAGGGGGFGGGGGYSNNTDRGGTGGFGGGAGSSFTHTGASPASFGGGYDATGHATGGAGMGGAIFNHAGTVALISVTATGNSATGGISGAGSPGSGLGAVLFNLNGHATIDFSTIAGNTLVGNNTLSDASGPADSSVYSLAYGYDVSSGGASIAALTINNSIVHGTQGATNADVVANLVAGNTAAINTSSLAYVGKNLVQHSYTVSGVTQSGGSPSTVDPLLGALSRYLPTVSLPVLPIGANSPATDATTNCSLISPAPYQYDERGTARPQGAQCDIGAYEFDNDYIFASGVDKVL
jgi:hypothetical protein